MSSAYLKLLIFLHFKSVQFSHSVVSESLWLHESQHTRPPCPSPTPGDYSNSCPSSQWRHPTISSSVVPFSSCPQSLPASGSFPIKCPSNEAVTPTHESSYTAPFEVLSYHCLPLSYQKAEGQWSHINFIGWFFYSPHRVWSPLTQTKPLYSVIYTGSVRMLLLFCTTAVQRPNHKAGKLVFGTISASFELPGWHEW